MVHDVVLQVLQSHSHESNIHCRAAHLLLVGLLTCAAVEQGHHEQDASQLPPEHLLGPPWSSAQILRQESQRMTVSATKPSRRTAAGAGQTCRGSQADFSCGTAQYSAAYFVGHVENMLLFGGSSVR